MTERNAGAVAVLRATGDSRIDGVLERHPDLARMAHAVYTPQGVRMFLTTPMARFDHRTALQLIEDGQIGRVISALAADYEGIS